MRGAASGRFKVVLLLSLVMAPSTLASAMEDDHPAVTSRDESSSSGFGSWFHFGSRTPDKKGHGADKKADKKSANASASPAPDPVEARAAVEATYFRRLAVCDQLTEIAIATNDKALERQAEELGQRAWEVYSRRVAQMVPASADETVAEPRVERKLDQEERSEHEQMRSSADAVDEAMPVRDAGKGEMP